MKNDNISRIICNDLNIRAYTVESLNTAKTIVKQHNTTPNATVALGRTINATALLSSTLKPDSDQNISVRFHGEGPISEIHVQADARGNIRGYVANPNVDIDSGMEKISFSQTIGAGFLTITRDLNMGEPYSGTLPLLSGEVASDIAYYLTTSEQIPSAVILGLNIDHEGEIVSSGGILIQTFPETEDNIIKKIENNIRIMPAQLGDLLEKGEDIYNIVADLFDNKPLAITDSMPIGHSCRCGRELLIPVFKNIDNEELNDMIVKDNGAEIICNFCNRKYIFSKADLTEFMN